MANDERDKQLDELYYNAQDPGSYGGVTRLLKRALEKRIEGINRKVVQEYLRDQQAYSVHKPARKQFLSKQNNYGRDRQTMASRSCRHAEPFSYKLGLQIHTYSNRYFL